MDGCGVRHYAESRRDPRGSRTARRLSVDDVRPPAGPSVSVLIPSHERRDALRRALTSLAGQRTESEFEVVVSVDGSTDGTLEMLAAFPAPYELRVVTGRRRGRAGALNAALREARGALIVILDDDMEVGETFVESHRRNHTPSSRLAVLGAVPVDVRPGDPQVARYIARRFGDHMVRLADPAHVFVTRDFYSGNVSLPASALREIGGFDESFTVYGNEDVELALRLRAIGVTLRFDAEARASQHYEKQFVGLFDDTTAKGRTAVLLARKHPDVFHELQLASPNDASRAWLALRAVLLALTRRIPTTQRAFRSAAALAERIGLSRQPLFYRAALDYAFWSGVDAALDPDEEDPRLRALRARLRRSEAA